MTKAVITGSIVLAILVGGAAVFYVKSQKSTNVGTQTDANQAVGNQDSAPSRNSLKSLLTGPNQKCTISGGTEGAQSDGTVYVASNRMRGDFSGSTESMGTVASHMIIKDDTVYTWMEGASEGFKSSLASMENNQETEPQNSNSVDVNSEVTFDCSTWLVDASMFEAPASIEFMDMSAYQTDQTMQDNPTPGNQVDENQSVCDQVPAAMREDCLKSLAL